MTGDEAMALTGCTRTQVDAAAAHGLIPAEYHGWQLLVAPPASGGVNEVQRITISGDPGPGQPYKLSFKGAWTWHIPAGSNPDAVQDALAALWTIGVGNVLVAKPSQWEYTVTFTGMLGHQNVELLGKDDALLAPGTVAVTVDTEGSTTAKKTTAKAKAKR